MGGNHNAQRGALRFMLRKPEQEGQGWNNEDAATAPDQAGQRSSCQSQDQTKEILSHSFLFPFRFGPPRAPVPCSVAGTHYDTQVRSSRYGEGCSTVPVVSAYFSSIPRRLLPASSYIKFGNLWKRRMRRSLLSIV